MPTSLLPPSRYRLADVKLSATPETQETGCACVSKGDCDVCEKCRGHPTTSTAHRRNDMHRGHRPYVGACRLPANPRPTPSTNTVRRLRTVHQCRLAPMGNLISTPAQVVLQACQPALSVQTPSGPLTHGPREGKGLCILTGEHSRQATAAQEGKRLCGPSPRGICLKTTLG